MKTISIKITHVWGTHNTIAVDLLYRHKVVKHFIGHNADKQSLIDAANLWAFNQGYHNVKTITGE
jgi:hypothetical protein